MLKCCLLPPVSFHFSCGVLALINLALVHILMGIVVAKHQKSRLCKILNLKGLPYSWEKVTKKAFISATVCKFKRNGLEWNSTIQWKSGMKVPECNRSWMASIPQHQVCMSHWDLFLYSLKNYSWKPHAMHCVQIKFPVVLYTQLISTYRTLVPNSKVIQVEYLFSLCLALSPD